MALKLRLQRHGKKGNAFFHIVAADGRAPRDGKFIYKLGTYNPNLNPAIIDLDFDRTLEYLQKGAQPTLTVKAILRYTGISMKNHLLKGVAKGALTAEQAEAKFEKWLKEKQDKIEGKKLKLSSEKENYYKNKMDAEKKASDARAAKIAAKSKPAEEAPAAEAQTEVPPAPEAPAAE